MTARRNTEVHRPIYIYSGGWHNFRPEQCLCPSPYSNVHLGAFAAALAPTNWSSRRRCRGAETNRTFNQRFAFGGGAAYPERSRKAIVCVCCCALVVLLSLDHSRTFLDNIYALYKQWLRFANACTFHRFVEAARSKFCALARVDVWNEYTTKKHTKHCFITTAYQSE